MNKKGFTLIEVIIVIVILGVLATLALPKITGNLKTAEAAEAMNMFGTIKRAAVQCYDTTETFASCDRSAELGVSIPGSSKFIYTANGTATTLTVTARRSASTAEMISMSVASDGDVTYQADAGGPFVGVVTKTGNSGAVTAVASTSTF